ncbi:MAG TPA: cyclic nucleotide-binding domain-containing protein [Stellaceae bacterium]|jgi:CRP/FNR family cyclic AMP-dependent transcriptional regulator|nr:cyclic nucleotide-binding domain-containing protein [Stellaceae bacterium]
MMSLKQEFELLRRVPIFAEIEPSRLKLLAFMSERVGYDPGKIVVRQGDPADAAYLIIDGHAEVVAETPAGPVILATLGANEIVGEMGILCNMPRNATVRAEDRLIALRISKESFMRMLREFPNISISIMQELAHRLEASNNQLRAAHTEINRLRERAGIAA